MKTPAPILAGFVLAATGLVPVLQAQKMTVESLDGPVTPNEINSFKAYIQTINPATWDGSSGTTTDNMANEIAQGHTGENNRAMGLMYEISGDRAILDRMIYFCDTLLSQRNDRQPAPSGQHLIPWTGTIAPEWLQGQGNPPTGDGSCTTGSGAGHLGNCTRLILQTPSLWNIKVGIGDPHGNGATYLERARTYLRAGDVSFDGYLFAFSLDLSDQNHLKYTLKSPYQPGNQLPWNQAMMVIEGMESLAWCHALLGDDPARLAKYDRVTQANIDRFFNDPAVRVIYPDGAGHPAYNWAYTPVHQVGEDSNHGAFDVMGFCHVYASGRYGITAAKMAPFGNMVADVLTATTGSLYHGRVDGTDGTGHGSTTADLRDGYFLTAEFVPSQYYNMAQGIHLAAGSSTGSIGAFSRLMWVKHRRNLASQDFMIATSPASQTLTAGSGTIYTASLSAVKGFTGTVTFSVGGLPTGATGVFRPTSVNGPGSSTLSVSTARTTPAGTYPITITATSGSLVRATTGGLVVNPPPH